MGKGRMYARHMKKTAGKTAYAGAMTQATASHTLVPQLATEALWCQAKLPELLFGGAVTVYTKGVEQKMSRAQNRLGRWILGLKQSASSTVVRSILEWNPISLEVAMGQVAWWYRILNMKPGRWPKMMLHKMRQNPLAHPWYESLQQLIRKYDINIHNFKGRRGARALREYLEQREWDHWRQDNGVKAHQALRKLHVNNQLTTLTNAQKKSITQLVSSDFLSIVGGRVEEKCPVCKDRWTDWRGHILERCLVRNALNITHSTVEAWVVEKLASEGITELQVAAKIISQWRTEARKMQLHHPDG